MKTYAYLSYWPLEWKQTLSGEVRNNAWKTPDDLNISYIAGQVYKIEYATIYEIHMIKKAELVRPEKHVTILHIIWHKKQKRTVITFTLHWKYSQTVGMIGIVGTIMQWTYQNCHTVQTFLACYSIGLVFVHCPRYRISRGLSCFFSVLPGRCQVST